MQEALPPLETEQQIRSHKNLALGIAASVILHVIGTAILLGLPQGSQAPQSITYIDLKTLAFPAPMTAPQKEATPPQTAPKPEMPLVPDTPVAPEAPAQAQQSTSVPEQTAAPQPAKVEEQLSHTTLGLGLTKGYFKALGGGETLRGGVKEYYLEMLQVINEKWWLDPKTDKNRIRPMVVNITVARSGEIVGTAIITRSGNPNYDRAVVAALTAASPLPPLPATFKDQFFQAPIRLVPPLNLMSW